MLVQPQGLLFLRIYNKSVCIKKESKISKILKGISHHRVTFLLFLILCTQIPGVASRELNTIDFHVTQEIVRIAEIYKITLERGKHKGYAKFVGKRIIEWELGRICIPRVIQNIGSSPEVSFCKQTVDLAEIKDIFQKVISCNDLGEILGHRNILYFRAYGSQLFYYKEEENN